MPAPPNASPNAPPHVAPTAQELLVIPAEALRVAVGAARGDPLGIADDLVMDDVYRLAPGAARQRLLTADAGRLTVAEGSEAGRPGNPLVLDCCATFMAPDGRAVEVLVLVELDGDAVAAVHALPLAAMQPRTDWRLVGLDRHAATARLAQVASASFARGTRITAASGQQVPVEQLRAGDRVLTRDDGAQAIRWIGQITLRATGDFAPVVIREGALHNAADLVLAPDHRLFVYQRQDRLGTGRAEVLVKARHLVNGGTVARREGGFVDYFQLLFDDHQIVFAEGIACESLLVDPRTRAAVPAGTAAHAPRAHMAYEVHESLLPGRDAAELLRRASAAR